MVMPNSLYEPGNPFAAKFKFAGYHMLAFSQKIIKVDGFNEFPAAVWRWTVQGRLTYGFGMAAKALPDIYVLNQSARTRMEAEQKMADPPMNIPAELMDDYHLGPGGRNFYRSPDRPITGNALALRHGRPGEFFIQGEDFTEEYVFAHCQCRGILKR